MDTMTENKVDRQADKLRNDHTINELRAMHREAFGVEWRGKDKAKVAHKLAVHVVTGNGTKGEAKPMPTTKAPTGTAGPDAAEDEAMARGALVRIKGAWDEVESLREERKTKMAEFKTAMSEATDAIAATLGDDKKDEAVRLRHVETHWRKLRRTEEKRAAAAKEFNDRIKASTQSMKSEMDNIRQLVLPLE
jgi:hypothetical protein